MYTSESMKTVIYLIAFLLTTYFGTFARTETPNRFPASTFLFMENKGQINDQFGRPTPEILFMANQHGLKVFINAQGLHYQFERHEEVFDSNSTDRIEFPELPAHKYLDQVKITTYRIDMKLLGANPHPEVIGEDLSPFYENFYNIPAIPNGILGVRSFGRVIVKDIYPNIDWVIYGQDGGMKYDFVVHPGGDAKMIQMRYEGANLVATEDGGVRLETPLGEIFENAPISFSGEDIVRSEFHVENNVLSFCFEEFDSRKTLRIDPDVVWSTYYGGNGTDWFIDLGLDPSGNVYAGGITLSTTMIAFGGFQNSIGSPISRDVFLVKFAPNGVRLWATYYGGLHEEFGGDIAVDNLGNVFQVGATNNTGLGANGFQNNHGGGYYDAFVVKFDGAGARIWATYYGGSADEYGEGIAVDDWGNVYAAISTNGGAMASGGHQNTYGGGSYDAFIVKFDAACQRQWATYYGGANTDNATSVAVDDSGNVYLVGNTKSQNSIAFNGFQDTLGGYVDAFVAKFNGSGQRIWGTYYGGLLYENSYSIDCSLEGKVFLSGYTNSAAGIAHAGHQGTIGGSGFDGFLVQMDTQGNRNWATYYGGVDEDLGYFVGSDSLGNSYLVGYTYSPNSIAFGGFQDSIAGDSDCFVASFDSSGSRIWGSYFGGLLAEFGTAGAVLSAQSLYLGGETSSINGIAIGGHQNTQGGSSDGFITKLCLGEQYYNQALVGCAGFSVIVGSNVYFASGTYVDTLSSWISGCDSIVTTELNIAAPIDTSVTINTPSLTANAIKGTFQWVDCADNYAHIPGAINSSFTPIISGYYGVIVSVGNCSDTSSCINMNLVGLIPDLGTALKLYPNPSDGYLSIDFGQEIRLATTKVSDLAGRIVFATMLENQSKVDLDLRHLSAGVYAVQIHIGEQMSVWRIAIEK